MINFHELATSHDKGFKTHWDIFNVGNEEKRILQVQKIDEPAGNDPLENDEQAVILALLYGVRADWNGIVRPEPLSILRLVGGIEPEIYGPYEDEDERQKAVRKMFPNGSYFGHDDTILLMDGTAQFYAPSDEYFGEALEDFIGDIFTPEQ